eukprot:5611193-Amphidinium_carterae.1
MCVCVLCEPFWQQKSSNVQRRLPRVSVRRCSLPDFRASQQPLSALISVRAICDGIDSRVWNNIESIRTHGTQRCMAAFLPREAVQ